jgi:hypothetical protein
VPLLYEFYQMLSRSISYGQSAWFLQRFGRGIKLQNNFVYSFCIPFNIPLLVLVDVVLPGTLIKKLEWNYSSWWWSELRFLKLLLTAKYGCPMMILT